jgi:hypothetical protein
MPKATRRYHSKKTGKYISRKQWLREGKKGVAKREKIGIGKRPPKKKKEPEPTPGIPERTVERLQYTSAKGTIDIDIIRTRGKLSAVKISKRAGHTKTYTRKSDIAKFSAVIYTAREQAALNKSERILEEIDDED